MIQMHSIMIIDCQRIFALTLTLHDNSATDITNKQIEKIASGVLSLPDHGVLYGQD